MYPELCKSFQQPHGMGFSSHFTDEDVKAPLRILVTSPRSLSNLERKA